MHYVLVIIVLLWKIRVILSINQLINYKRIFGKAQVNDEDILPLLDLFATNLKHGATKKRKRHVYL